VKEYYIWLLTFLKKKNLINEWQQVNIIETIFINKQDSKARKWAETNFYFNFYGWGCGRIQFNYAQNSTTKN
jgi:hypothetical protein